MDADRDSSSEGGFDNSSSPVVAQRGPASPVNQASVPAIDIAHSKPITPAEIFDSESSNKGSDLRSNSEMKPHQSDTPTNSRKLMPPPARPNHTHQRAPAPVDKRTEVPAIELEPPTSPPGPDDDFRFDEDPMYYRDNNYETSIHGLDSDDDDDDNPVPGALGELEPISSQLSEPQDLPEDPLEPFDWDELEQRYHDLIEDKEKDYDEIWTEYCHLQDVSKIHAATVRSTGSLTHDQFFAVWSGMVGKRETDRTFKRFAHFFIKTY